MSLLNLGVIGLHSILIYFFLIICMSHLNHRLRAQVSIDELLIVTLLGSAVETSLIGGNTALLAGIVSAATLIASNWLLSHLVYRWRWLHDFLIGHPILLVNEGNLMPDKLREASLTEEDLLESIREHGIEKIEQVKLAVLEIDGSISVIPKENK
jgi:Predicted membrane protein